VSNCFWRAKAIERWPGIPVTSTGRFALLSLDGKDGAVKSVYLMTDYEGAKICARDVQFSRIEDLMKEAVTTAVAEMKDRHPDSDDWEKRLGVDGV
jgi:arginyl-tRNA synthetase